MGQVGQGRETGGRERGWRHEGNRGRGKGSRKQREGRLEEKKRERGKASRKERGGRQEGERCRHEGKGKRIGFQEGEGLGEYNCGEGGKVWRYGRQQEKVKWERGGFLKAEVRETNIETAGSLEKGSRKIWGGARGQKSGGVREE